MSLSAANISPLSDPPIDSLGGGGGMLSPSPRTICLRPGTQQGTMAACPAAAASGESLIQSSGFRLPGAAFLVFTSCFCAACRRTGELWRCEGGGAVSCHLLGGRWRLYKTQRNLAESVMEPMRAGGLIKVPPSFSIRKPWTNLINTWCRSFSSLITRLLYERRLDNVQRP